MTKVLSQIANGGIFSLYCCLKGIQALLDYLYHVLNFSGSSVKVNEKLDSEMSDTTPECDRDHGNFVNMTKLFKIAYFVHHYLGNYFYNF